MLQKYCIIKLLLYHISPATIMFYLFNLEMNTGDNIINVFTKAFKYINCI